MNKKKASEDRVFGRIESIHDTVQIIGDSVYKLDKEDLNSLIIELQSVEDKLDDICFIIENQD